MRKPVCITPSDSARPIPELPPVRSPRFCKRSYAKSSRLNPLEYRVNAPHHVAMLSRIGFLAGLIALLTISAPALSIGGPKRWNMPAGEIRDANLSEFCADLA